MTTETTAAPSDFATRRTAAPPNGEPIQVEAYFDGACPLCRREVAALRRLDRHGRIRFTDIAAEGFDAAAVGVPQERLEARIHGRLPDGRIIEGVEVFRRLYAAVGFGPLVALTRLPGISHLLDAAYAVFARNRYRLTGRCRDGECEVHAPRGAARGAGAGE